MKLINIHHDGNVHLKNENTMSLEKTCKLWQAVV